MAGIPPFILEKFTMIDLILIAVFVGVFYAGFKLGNKYKTLTELFAAIKSRIGQ